MQIPEFNDQARRFQYSSSAAYARAAAPLDWSDKAVDFLFNARGRISRGAYWLSGFVILLVEATIFAIASPPVVALLHGTFNTLPLENPLYVLAENLTMLLALGIAVWIHGVMVIKRWHDLDRSGAWTLIVLVPFVGSLFQLVMCGFIAGTPGANRFGPAVRY